MTFHLSALLEPSQLRFKTLPYPLMQSVCLSLSHQLQGQLALCLPVSPIAVDEQDLANDELSWLLKIKRGLIRRRSSQKVYGPPMEQIQLYREHLER